EVEYHEHKSHTIWVRFPVVSADPAAADLAGAQVIIWTTTPWTIPQNRAICFNPAIAYGLYRITSAPEDAKAVAGETLLLADRLAAETFEKARIPADGWERVRDVSADELAAIVCAHPFRGAEGANSEWDFDVPVIAADHVTDDAGTGFVHTAP